MHTVHKGQRDLVREISLINQPLWRDNLKEKSRPGCLFAGPNTNDHDHTMTLLAIQ